MNFSGNSQTYFLFALQWISPHWPLWFWTWTQLALLFSWLGCPFAVSQDSYDISSFVDEYVKLMKIEKSVICFNIELYEICIFNLQINSLIKQFYSTHKYGILLLSIFLLHKCTITTLTRLNTFRLPNRQMKQYNSARLIFHRFKILQVWESMDTY